MSKNKDVIERYEEDIEQTQHKIYHENNRTQIIYQTENYEYILQLFILKSTKELSISLETNDILRSTKKSLYKNTFSLSDLAKQNSYFAKFTNYIDAFTYVLNNIYNISKTDIITQNTNKYAKVEILLIDENIIEFTLNNINNSNRTVLISNNKINKSNSSSVYRTTIKKKKDNFSVASIINNFKDNLDNCNKNIITLKKKFTNDLKDKDFQINDLKKNFNEKFEKQAENMTRNNNLIIDKENELSVLIEEKFKEFFNQIEILKNNLNDMNNKYQNIENKYFDLDNKTNVFTNQLIKKLNKNNEFKEEFNIKIKGLIGNINEVNKNLEKKINLENDQKFFDISQSYDIKIKNLEDKICEMNNRILIINANGNTTCNLNNNNDIFKINNTNNNFNDYEKIIDKKIYNISNEFNTNLEKLKEDNINKLKEFEEKINNNIKSVRNETISQNNNTTNNDDIIKKTNPEENKPNSETLINQEISQLQNIITKNTDDISEINSKMKMKIVEIENKLQNTHDKNIKDLLNKIQEMKKDIYSSINKNANYDKDSFKEVNNKILTLRNDFNKSSSLLENKFKLLETKIVNTDSKLTKFENKNKENENLLKNIDNRIKIIENKIKNLENVKPKEFNLSSPRNNNKNTLSSSYILPKKGYYSNSNLITNNITKNLNFYDNSLKDYEINQISLDTKILNPNKILEDLSFIFNKLNEIYIYKKMKLILSYRASIDGDTSKIFHQKCDILGPSLTMIKTKKGYIFGGFTSKNWQHFIQDVKKDDPENGTEYKDEKAFCFSINNQKIYSNYKTKENIIYCNNRYGPVFKGFFKIMDECLKNGGICLKMEGSALGGVEKEYEFNGEEKNFDVEDVEVFQVITK